MLAYLKKHERSCRTILAEKVDRLYRNIRDWATLDELGVAIHFVKENVIISPEARSADQFLHGIKVLMARNYVQNLGEETLKGMTEKARAGIYPSYAPVGYRIIDGPNGKRIIAPHTDEAPIVSELFAQFATGNYSLKTLALHTREQGVTLRGRKLYVSTLHQILSKRIYTGSFDFNGATYQGSHEPLITTEVWDRVQRILNERKEHQTKGVRREFPFTGLINCGHCGLRLVAELKKAVTFTTTAPDTVGNAQNPTPGKRHSSTNLPAPSANWLSPRKFWTGSRKRSPTPTRPSRPRAQLQSSVAKRNLGACSTVSTRSTRIASTAGLQKPSTTKTAEPFPSKSPKFNGSSRRSAAPSCRSSPQR
jgi:DNA invertase Pin-like site-specific DNA recombinase